MTTEQQWMDEPYIGDRTLDTPPTWMQYRAIAARAREKNGDEAEVAQVMCLAEEVGEFVQQARRYLGLARAPGNRGHLREELADVIIAANVAAWMFYVELDAEVDLKLRKIKERGGL